MFMCEARRGPVAPAPEMILIVPGGKPALTMSSPTAREPRGHFSEGLKMKGVASGNRRAGFYTEEEIKLMFHGAIPAQKPNGS